MRSFRPLSGKWGYRFKQGASGIIATHAEQRFRPLSGKWGYRSCSLSIEELQKRWLVSVPSRRNGVIDQFHTDLHELAVPWRWFPSPLGEMGLSIYQNSEQAKAVRERFPSPLGEMGLSIKYVRWCIEHGFVSEFPSPLGEMGLSIFSNCLESRGHLGRFPSPLGEMGLSI